jgi:[ribosomal protein S5]-alanine N-acetyltransferase
LSRAGLDLLFEKYPVLEAEELVLREATAADVSSVFSIFSDPEVVEFYDLDVLESPDQAAEMLVRWRRRFENREGVRWAITRAGQRQVIGTVGLHVQSDWKAGLGYDLGRPYWRQGIMTQALKAVLSCAFHEIELERLEALVMPGNQASGGLLAKLGFRREGLLRRYAYFKGTHQDLECFSLLRGEFGR